ncbi:MULTISPECIES: hypothetical protein [Brevibacillus]|uniref:hypothetical protein n=1 Tax=Brevibacillus TaxID=55080 RepID=UPI000E2F6D75|nr:MULTISPECIES: hypothetical protein [Brevibacillus]MED1790630.1 hypothetical protein [Brevibacillus laterosporus]RFB35716.1 hypothetical protein DZB91_09490 [Brevibacillus sp. VP]
MLVLAVIFLVVSIVLFLNYWFASYNPGKLVISAPFEIGSYEFDRASLTGEEMDIAWKLYVQLTTRKAAIPVSEDDIIIEIYDSWYELFKSTREYLVALPAQVLEGNENAQSIVNLSTEVLNQGLRPHLTKWQGKYRRWYDSQAQDPANKNVSPQEIQVRYPHYKELIADIKRVNIELIKYAEELKRFSYEKPPNFSTKAVAWFDNIWNKLK